MFMYSAIAFNQITARPGVALELLFLLGGDDIQSLTDPPFSDTGFDGTVFKQVLFDSFNFHPQFLGGPFSAPPESQRKPWALIPSLRSV